MKIVAEFIFYGLMLLLALYSFLLVFILLRYGKSRILSLVLSGLYALVMFSLFAAASLNLERLPFADYLNF